MTEKTEKIVVHQIVLTKEKLAEDLKDYSYGGRYVEMAAQGYFDLMETIGELLKATDALNSYKEPTTLSEVLERHQRAKENTKKLVDEYLSTLKVGGSQ